MHKTHQQTTDGLLTIEQASARIGVSAGTLWRRIAGGDLVAVRLGRRCTRIRVADLEAMIHRGRDEALAGHHQKNGMQPDPSATATDG